MIIAKQLVQTPYMKYSAHITGVAVRKLTIMEWTLLRIVNDYSVNPKYKSFKLSQFFEEILGMNRSELLIRPCINSLLRLKLIEIDGYTSFSMAADTVVGKIHLTESGLNALQRNYIPGESRETEECIYYDLLSGIPQASLEDLSIYDTENSAVRITAQADFEFDFPVDGIIDSINTGRLFLSKYKGNNAIALDAVCTGEELIWSTDLLRLDQEDDGTYSCNYPLTNDVFNQLIKMTSAPFKSSDAWMTWDNPSEFPPTMLGAKESLSDIENYFAYSDYIFIKHSLWNEFSKKFKKKLKGTTCIIFGAKQFDIVLGDTISVFVPLLPEDNGTILMVPGKEVVCAAQARCNIENRVLDVWFSYRKSLPISVQDWFTQQITDSNKLSPNMAALIFLPVAEISASNRMGLIKTLLGSAPSFEEKAELLQKINKCCHDLRIDLPNYSYILDDLIEITDYTSADSVIDTLNIAYNKVFSDCDWHLYSEYVLGAAAIYGFRTGILDTYRVLSCILQCKGIDLESFIRVADNKVFSYIPEAELDGMFSAFSENLPELIPEISTVSKDYNELIRSMKSVSELLRNADWYAEADRNDILNDIIMCEELPKAQEATNTIKRILQKLQDIGCTVFSDNGICAAISERTMLLSQILSCFVCPNGEVATVYLIDTCAFMHSPDILKFFNDDEMVRVPFAVLRELDKHKDSNQDEALRKRAAYACKMIEEKMHKAEAMQDDHFAVESCNYPELLPPGFSPTKLDDLILSAALHYKLLNPVIITDDTNFRNISRTQGISTLAWESFVLERGGNATRSGGEKQPERGVDKPNKQTDGGKSNDAPGSTVTTEEKPKSSLELFTEQTIPAGAKKLGLNNTEIGVLLAAKIKTVGDFISVSEDQLRELFKKKKPAIAHVITTFNKAKKHAESLSSQTTTNNEETIEPKADAEGASTNESSSADKNAEETTNIEADKAPADSEVGEEVSSKDVPPQEPEETAIMELYKEFDDRPAELKEVVIVNVFNRAYSVSTKFRDKRIFRDSLAMCVGTGMLFTSKEEADEYAQTIFERDGYAGIAKVTYSDYLEDQSFDILVVQRERRDTRTAVVLSFKNESLSEEEIKEKMKYSKLFSSSRKATQFASQIVNNLNSVFGNDETTLCSRCIDAAKIHYDESGKPLYITRGEKVSVAWRKEDIEACFVDVKSYQDAIDNALASINSDASSLYTSLGRRDALVFAKEVSLPCLIYGIHVCKEELLDREWDPELFECENEYFHAYSEGLSECINLQKEHSIKSIQKTIDVIAYAPDKSETSTELFEKKFHFSDDTFEAPDYMPTIDVSYSVTLINEFDEYLKRILNRADEIVAVIESDQESLQIPITEIQQSVYEKTGIIVNIINSKTTVVGLIKKTFSLAKSILTFDDESEDEGDIEPQPHLESVPT